MQPSLSLCILACLCALAHANLYQTCSLAIVKEGFSQTYADMGSLYRPYHDEPYSHAFNSTHTLYWNVCGGTARCQGASYCFIEGDVITPIVYASSEAGYYTMMKSSGSTFTTFNTDRALSSRQATSYICKPGQVMNVTGNVYWAAPDDEDPEMMALFMDVWSETACSEVELPPYTPPRGFDNLSGEIYLMGRPPMFNYDKVASSGEDYAFEGSFYYSRDLVAFKLVGTLSNRQGETSQVGYLVQADPGDGNPGMSIASLNLPNSSERTCVLLPSPIDHFSYSSGNGDMGWFETSLNPAQGSVRNYTSIHFNKGTTFEVNTWTSDSALSSWADNVALTLMERVSDGLPVFLGDKQLAPWEYTDNQEFFSEINWATLETDVIPASEFDLPQNWNCQM